MKLQLLILLVFVSGLLGCAEKKNYIVLSGAGDGPVGSLQVSNMAGTSIIGDGGRAVSLADRNSRPEPVSMSEADKQKLFGAALAVQPLAPVSYSLAFEPGSDQLTQASRELLPQILATIKGRNSQDVMLLGHTDRVGDEVSNYQLGMARATGIRDLLIAQGVEAGSIAALSYGEGDPLVPTEKNVPEERNRRVVVVIR